MLQVWRNFGPKTAKRTAFLTRFLLPAEPLCFSLHRGLLPQPPPPPVCTPPYTSTQIFIGGGSTTATVTFVNLCRFLLLSSSSCYNHRLPLQQHHRHLSTVTTSHRQLSYQSASIQGNSRPFVSVFPFHSLACTTCTVHVSAMQGKIITRLLCMSTITG